MLSYIDKFDSLLDTCWEYKIKVKFVGKDVLKDFVGMNSEAAKQMGFKMPKNTIYLLRSMGIKTTVHTLNHEMLEMGLIRRGMSYWNAHCIALKNENT